MNDSPSNRKDDQRFWKALRKDRTGAADTPGADTHAGVHAKTPADSRAETRADSPARPSAAPPTHPEPSDNGTPVTGDQERERRRRSLLSMLAATQARQQQARRNRLPALVPGLVVMVRTGEKAGLRGTVCDADYIHGRALLQLAGETDQRWIPFRDLAALDDDETGS